MKIDMVQPDVKELISNPDYLAYKINFETENLEFLATKQQTIQQASFLRRDVIAPDQPLIPVPLSALVSQLGSLSQSVVDNPPRFIFHTAYCASTFLSKSLDVRGHSIGLREPQILLDAANAKRLQWRSTTTHLDYTKLPELALGLLQKHAQADEKLIIKPINSVNNIIPELLRASPSSRSILLYTDAKNFLCSTLRKGEHGRQRTRAMFDLLRCDFPQLANLGLSDVIHMSDLKIILTFWRLQIEQAQQALKTFTNDNKLVSLYAEKLINGAHAALPAISEHLHLGISSSKIQQIASSDDRLRDAKNPEQQFSLQKRADSYRKVEEFYGTDLDNGYHWVTQNNPSVSLYPKLGNALSLAETA